MPTLKVILEKVASLGPEYLISDHGSYWLVNDLLERLEQDAPERLAYLVSWVVPEGTLEGAIYASDHAEEVFSTAPLYQIHRLTSTRQPLDFPDPDAPHPEAFPQRR